MVKYLTRYRNFSLNSWDTPGLRFTIKPNKHFVRYVYFAQLQHHQEDTDFYDRIF